MIERDGGATTRRRGIGHQVYRWLQQFQFLHTNHATRSDEIGAIDVVVEFEMQGAARLNRRLGAR